jgi:hypothetical protein
LSFGSKIRAGDEAHFVSPYTSNGRCPIKSAGYVVATKTEKSKASNDSQKIAMGHDKKIALIEHEHKKWDLWKIT